MAIAEAGIFLSILKFIHQIIPSRPVIRLDVVKLYYSLIEYDPYGEFAICTSEPSRYQIVVQISHLRGRKTTIRKAILTIGDTIHIEAPSFKPFVMEEGNLTEKSFTFPVEKHKAVKREKYEIQLIDIYNKKYKNKGVFPIS